MFLFESPLGSMLYELHEPYERVMRVCECSVREEQESIMNALQEAYDSIRGAI